jgi:hypothetical protein
MALYYPLGKLLVRDDAYPIRSQSASLRRGDLVAGAVVELGGLGSFVVDDGLGMLDPAAGGEKLEEAAEGVVDGIGSAMMAGTVGCSPSGRRMISPLMIRLPPCRYPDRGR